MSKLSAILATIALSCAMPFYSYAQNAYEVKGLVFDEVGPMIGASVLEKGTSNGTATGSDGDYVLAVSSAEAIVEISSIGYKTVSFKASEIPAKVYLEVDSQMLEETVVVGYGSLSKKEVSSSIVSISEEDFNKAPAGDPMQLLVGKVAGLNIVVAADGGIS